MTDTYLIAEKTIRIRSLHEAVHTYCKDYRCSVEGEADIDIIITNEDIEFERERSDRTAAAEGRVNKNWSDGYLEGLAVYRKIAERMPYFDTFLFHGSAISVDGVGYLFTAGSGTGKSTHAALWRELLKERAVMINDDKPLLHIGENGAVIYGTPYNGKHRLGSNVAVPLKAICVLERAKENTITRIGKSQVYPMLMQQSYRPKDPVSLAKTLQLIDKLSDCVSFWKLGCNISLEAAETSFGAMSASKG